MNIPQETKKGQVKETFTGENLTIFGGTGLIRRFFKKIGLKEALCSLDTIHPREGYSSSHIVLSLLYGLFLGKGRPYHMMALVRDRVFLLVSRLSSFPVQSTISRFFKRLRKAVSVEVSSTNLQLLLEVRHDFKGYPKGLTLDLDSHVTTVFGNQQRAQVGFNPKKKGRKSYHPLLAFIGETRDFVMGTLRPGDTHTSYKAIGLSSSIFKLIPVAIKRLRADCGFFSKEFILWLIRRGIEYYITVPLQPWVQRLILGQGAWVLCGRDIWYKELTFSLGELSSRFVTIRTRIKGEEGPKKELSLFHGEDALYDYQVVATNSKGEAFEVWRFYNKRANVENMVKEGIYSFGLDNVVSHEWAANSLWFEVVMFAYNLMNWFKEKVLGQRERKSFGESIRQRLLFIPGRLIQSGRSLILKLERSWYGRGAFEEALQRLAI